MDINIDTISKEYIEEYEHALDDELCDAIIQKFELENGKYPGITRGGLNINVKKTMDFSLKNQQNDEWTHIDSKLFIGLNNAVVKYREKYEAFQSFHKLEDTGFMIQKYKAKDGFYKYHHDFISNKENYRVLTFLFYLNDVLEGGETEFFYGKFKVIPKKGKLVLFPASWTFPHCGKMPLSNDKYIITGWFYDKNRE